MSFRFYLLSCAIKIYINILPLYFAYCLQYFVLYNLLCQILSCNITKQLKCKTISTCIVIIQNKYYFIYIIIYIIISIVIKCNKIVSCSNQIIFIYSNLQ